MNPFYKNLALWIVITLMMIMLYNLFNQQHLAETNISYTSFLSMVENEQIAEVDVNPLLITPQGRPVAVDALVPGDRDGGLQVYLGVGRAA